MIYEDFLKQKEVHIVKSGFKVNENDVVNCFQISIFEELKTAGSWRD